MGEDRQPRRQPPVEAQTGRVDEPAVSLRDRMATVDSWIDRASATGPGLVDGLALLAEVADELVVRTVRDTHLAGSRRAYAAVQRRTSGAAALRAWWTTASPAGCTPASVSACGRRRWAWAWWRPPAAGRGWTRAAGTVPERSVIGLIGDRLARERPNLAWPMSLRRGGADGRRGWTGTHSQRPTPRRGRISSFPPGLCEDETAWDRHADRHGTTYPGSVGGDRLESADAARQHRPGRPGQRSPVGRPARRRGRRLAGRGGAGGLGGPLDGGWPRRPGGLCARTPRDRRAGRRWSPTWSPSGRRTSGRRWRAGPAPARPGWPGCPRRSAFGRIIDQRSVGILDLERGLDLDADRPACRDARMRLVSGSLPHPSGHARARRPPGPPGLRDGRRTVVPGRRRAARARRRPLRPPEPSRRTARARRLARRLGQASTVMTTRPTGWPDTR